MIFSLFLAILFVYMILAALLESFLYPITIMASVPMAAIGCLVILYVSGKSINVPVYVGAITLAGIVVNNAVVLIDYIKLLKSRGMANYFGEQRFGHQGGNVEQALHLFAGKKVSREQRGIYLSAARSFLSS